MRKSISDKIFKFIITTLYFLKKEKFIYLQFCLFMECVFGEQHYAFVVFEK